MSVQDDERERELVRMFNLHWDPSHQRGGVDAVLDVAYEGRKYQFEVEVKSTTGNTVSTARDVGMEHIQKWRSKLFIIGFYSKEAGRPELQRSLCLTPVDMEPWIASIEKKILIDFKLAACASRRLILGDLYEVCGQQDSYSPDDAKRLHKQQWSADEYAAALDSVVDGKPRVSKEKMLEILHLRSKYIAERGATLNNPHITKTHLDRFAGSAREVSGPNWAEAIRLAAISFLQANPTHVAVRELQ
ncbi:MAG: hypothetical protein Q8N89_09515 [Azonexus sp.]|nr:hypothetical protein [Azonexus sp.]